MESWIPNLWWRGTGTSYLHSPHAKSHYRRQPRPLLGDRDGVPTLPAAWACLAAPPPEHVLSAGLGHSENMYILYDSPSRTYK